MGFCSSDGACAVCGTVHARFEPCRMRHGLRRAHAPSDDTAHVRCRTWPRAARSIASAFLESPRLRLDLPACHPGRPHGYAAHHGTPDRARTAPIRRRSRPVRDRLRQRRLLDLLRARARRRPRARAHAAGVRVRRRAVRADGENVRRGRRDVPRSRRLLLVRAPRLQRRRLVLRRLGAEPRLHPHDRHLGVLRSPLPERVPRPALARSQPRRHRRRADRRGGARRAEHPRAGRVGEAQLRPGDRRPEHADRARRPRVRARVQPDAADPSGAPRQRPQLARTDLRAVAGDARLHRHRDGREHGRGVPRPRASGPQGRQPRRAGRARRLRRHLGRRPVGPAGRPSRRRLQRGAAAVLQLPRLCHRAGRALPERPGAGGHLPPGPARDGPETGRILRRPARRDDPVHRHQRRHDRDLAPVLVAVRASPAAAPVLTAASQVPHALVHADVLLRAGGRAGPVREHRSARQPLLVRRDAVVHDRPRGGHRAARQGPRSRAPLPDAPGACASAARTSR